MKPHKTHTTSSVSFHLQGQPIPMRKRPANHKHASSAYILGRNNVASQPFIFILFVLQRPRNSFGPSDSFDLALSSMFDFPLRSHLLIMHVTDPHGLRPAVGKADVSSKSMAKKLVVILQYPCSLKVFTLLHPPSILLALTIVRPFAHSR